jgi:hypothetical protein
MDTKMYIKVSMLNLAFLVTGMGLKGFLDARVVHAQSQPQPQVEEITPSISAESAGFRTLLAGRFAADQVMIRGVDMGKLQENLINLLATKPLVASRPELQDVIDRAKATPFRMKAPEPPKPQGGKP